MKESLRSYALETSGPHWGIESLTFGVWEAPAYSYRRDEPMI